MYCLAWRFVVFGVAAGPFLDVDAGVGGGERPLAAGG